MSKKSSAMGQEFGCECPNAAVRSQPEPQQPAAEVDSLGWSCGHRSAKVAAPVAPKWMIPATGSHYFALGQSMGLMGPGSCRTNELNLADGPLGVQSSASGATCPSANPGHRRLSLFPRTCDVRRMHSALTVNIWRHLWVKVKCVGCGAHPRDRNGRRDAESINRSVAGRRQSGKRCLWPGR